MDKISSYDAGYIEGDLSVFPIGLDTDKELYLCKNNSETKLSHTLSYNASSVTVDSTESFPDFGIINVGEEFIYYDKKTSNKFLNLKRGFLGSSHKSWNTKTPVYGSVMSEHHNAIKDAVIQIEKNLGTSVSPEEESLNGILKKLERKFTSPRSIFKGYPRTVSVNQSVAFKNFSTGDVTRSFWDFGDGTTSTQDSPVHTYETEGNYDVTLTVITKLNSQAIMTKKEYITVVKNSKIDYFYFSPSTGTTSTTFNFVDQSDGEIASRYWVWGDGSTETVNDPNTHIESHQYSEPGQYIPLLVLIYLNGNKKVVYSESKVIVN